MFLRWFEKIAGQRRSRGRYKNRLPRRCAGAQRVLWIEELEARIVLSYTPAEISHAYTYDDVFFPTSSGSFVKGDGTGQTIAIVVAYQQPNLAADLHAFDQQFGLSDPQLTICNGTGSTSSASLPADATGNWGIEASLDVEWAHALAPGANLLVVEASSSASLFLFQAVQTARNAGIGTLSSLPNTSIVSMSWGQSDALGDGQPTLFTTPAGKTGVTFVAATGDQGTGGDYPAADPYVLAVGGTSLTLDGQGNYVSESGWSGSNGGFGPNSVPAYQQGVQPSGTQNTNGVRMTPDVSFNATGFSIFDSYDSPGSPWMTVNGTSTGTPCWAALIAIADQGLSLGGAGPLAGNQMLTDLYAIYGNGNYQYAFHDITSGSNASHSAGTGYDLVTGLGSPRANVIANLLAGDSLIPTSIGPSGTSSSTTPTFQWSAIGSATGYYLTLVDTTTGQTVANNLAVATNSYTPTTPLNSGDSYQWQVQAYDGTTPLAPPSSTNSFTDSPVPQVTSVIVDGESWSSGFLDAPKSSGFGSLGYAIPVGSVAQLQPLPWVNVNQVRIAFNENVNIQQSSLTLSGVSLSYYTFSSFNYNATTFTATWTLTAPIGADRLHIDLHASGAAAVTDAHGQSLDGEWNNSVSSYPSGNGSSGGDFLFDFNVLPGDANGDGVVNGLDINLFAGNFNQVGGGLAADVNGDGIVNGLDLNLIAAAWESMLPGGGSGMGTNVALAATTVSTWSPNPSQKAPDAVTALQHLLIERAIIESVTLPSDPDAIGLIAASVAATAKDRITSEPTSLLLCHSSVIPPTTDVNVRIERS
jgi:Dockerin type I domain